MRRLAWCAAALSGCGAALPAPDPALFQALDRAPSFPGLPGEPDRFARWLDFEPRPECRPDGAADLGLATELRLFRGAGVAEEDLRRYAGALQRWWGWYGVRFYTRHEPIALPLTHALVADPEAIRVHVLAETGMDVGLPAPLGRRQEARDAVCAAFLHNVRALLDVYGEPRRGAINVVVLAEMSGGEPSGPLASMAGVAGLGVSPALLDATGADGAQSLLYRCLDVDDGFTPTAIVGMSVIDRWLDEPDKVIAHEVGHAYGLVHSQLEGNLMRQGPAPCDVALDPAQTEVVREAAPDVAAVPGAPVSLSDGAEALSAALRALVR